MRWSRLLLPPSQQFRSPVDREVRFKMLKFSRWQVAQGRPFFHMGVWFPGKLELERNSWEGPLRKHKEKGLKILVFDRVERQTSFTSSTGRATS